MHLQFRWPHTTETDLRENFYFGGWYPNGPLSFEWESPPPTIQPSCLQADNWFLVSNTSALHSKPIGLVHADIQQAPSEKYTEAFAFRGYILAPAIHSYSSEAELLEYWRNSTPSTQHNGVFSAVCIRHSGKTLDLTTDAFGMEPLYYRQIGELILFASNSRFLTLENEAPDYMAWRCLVQAGFLAADRTLSNSIKRVPAAHILRFQKDKAEQIQWFDYHTLPEGVETVNEQAFIDVEEAFNGALSKCAKLRTEGHVLPLSSGFDSRRLLAGLMDRQVHFEALTVQMFEKGYWNLDSRITSQMATELGFPHTVIEFPGIQQYVKDDRQRRLLLNAECDLHAWALPLMHSLPSRSCVVFDGLAGDVLGNAKFLAPLPKSTEPYLSPENDTKLIVQQSVNDVFDRILNLEKWPSSQELRHELEASLNQLPPIMNRSTLAKLLLRTRRTIAPWGSQMLPAGHVLVSPFLDIDFVKLTLSYHPASKLAFPLQKECLARFQPRYFAYPGSKAIPKDFPPPDYSLQNQKQLACFRGLYQELLARNDLQIFTALLSSNARFRFWLTRKNSSLAIKWMWAFKRLLDIVCQYTGNLPCWEISPED